MMERTEFKGNPIIVLFNDPNDQYRFQFGLNKAKLILQHIDDIKQFVEDNS